MDSSGTASSEKTIIVNQDSLLVKRRRPATSSSDEVSRANKMRRKYGTSKYCIDKSGFNLKINAGNARPGI